MEWKYSMKPFTKWVGGKRQLLPQILGILPDKFNKYYEPFVGGGTLFFELAPSNATINDNNEELILAYKVIKENKAIQKIIESKRINIDYAEEAKDYLWRFYIKDNKYVSVK